MSSRSRAVDFADGLQDEPHVSGTSPKEAGCRADHAAAHVAARHALTSPPPPRAGSAFRSRGGSWAIDACRVYLGTRAAARAPVQVVPRSA